MLPPDLENYLSEIARVMKKGGKCAITYFLLNEESIRLIQAGEIESPNFNFIHQMGEFWTSREDLPEDALAYPEEFIRNLYPKYGLKIVEPIHYGRWCKRPNPVLGQDIIVAVKL